MANGASADANWRTAEVDDLCDALLSLRSRDEVAAFLRDYVLSAGDDLFTIVSRPAAEKLLRLPHRDPVTVWALATLATLSSGEWLNARDDGGPTFAIPVPG